MAARTSVATDDFNRANGGLGANWSNLNTAEADVVTIGTNRFHGTVAGFYAAARWNGTGTFADDQYSSTKLVGLDNYGTGYAVGVIARASADTDTTRDYYYVRVEYNASPGGNFTTTLGKIVNGTNTNLNSATVAWVDNDKVEIECEGTTIRAMKNGTALGGAFTVTDSALTTGKPGVLAGGAATIDGDDWEGGSLTSGGPPTGTLTASGVASRMDLGMTTQTTIRG